MKSHFHLPLTAYPDSSSFCIIQNAVDLAFHHDAMLTASLLQVAMSEKHPMGSMTDAEVGYGELQPYGGDISTSLGDALRNYASKAGISSELVAFQEKEPFVGQAFAERARAYDVSILEASETTRPLIESILFESGRPIVVFPTDGFDCRIDTVAVAWDGSATLSRAITGSRPFLEKASRVILISAVDDKQIDMGARDRLVGVLSSAGWSVDIVAIQAGAVSVGSAIQIAALEKNAGLLIAGAYGHSKFHELILGGVTRSLLTKLEIPALLCH